jgi:hypothetical protein
LKKVFVVWRNGAGDELRDLMIAVSTENGATFSVPKLKCPSSRS